VNTAGRAVRGKNGLRLVATTSGEADRSHATPEQSVDPTWFNRARHVMLPDIESLRCFERAAAMLNFRAAADSIHLSPSAFSDRIRRLEDQVGERLFRRTTRFVSLTSAGQRLLAQARRTLHEAARCVGAADDSRKLPLQLTIGTEFELGLSWLTPAIASLRTARPERTLHLVFDYQAEDLLSRLKWGDVDCVVSTCRSVDSTLRSEPLRREDLVLVGSPRLLAALPLAGAEHAHRHTLLDLTPELPLFQGLLEARPPRERWTFLASEALGAMAAVRLRALEGAGVAVLPRYLVEQDLSTSALCEALAGTLLHGGHSRLIWRAGYPGEDELRRFAEELRAVPLARAA
jgi:LysR family glycine cleavage system transcriptional activator